MADAVPHGQRVFNIWTYDRNAPALPVLILHTGDPEPSLKERFGSYAEQIAVAAGLEAGEVEVVPVHEGARPRAPQYYRAALITGSPAMVTDREPWSEDTAAWLREAAAAGLPMFGVCYGHQLLAHALGGKVGYNPTGSELGTQTVELLPPAAGDQLLDGLPASFPAQMLHAQTVLQPPPGAAVLARSDQDPHQMFRVGPNVFSTQFHPEFGPDFVRAHLERYQRKYMAENLDVPGLAANVRATPVAGGLLRRFLDLCARRQPSAISGVRGGRALAPFLQRAIARARAPPHEPSRRPSAPARRRRRAPCRALEAEQPPDLNTLAEQAGMSRFHFHRVFKAATGVTPKAYATALRASRARQQLRESASVTDAMYDAGFNSSGRFYEAAPAMLA